MATMTKEVVYGQNNHGGREVTVTSIHVGDKSLIVQGRLLVIARLKDEWFDDIGDPELILKGLRASAPVPDIFTFWQRLPDITPLYPYYNEPEALSAVPLKDFDHWWNKQIKSDTRKKAKRAENRGVEIRSVTLDDDLVQGVMGIFNETPIRRGMRFWHYGKSFESVKEILSRDLETSRFIGAYFEGELVGIVKLNFADRRFVNPGLFVTKIQYRREKYLDNALLAKSIEVCTQAGIPYFTYTMWRRGSHAEFLERNGFEKTNVPRYWIPLTNKGALAIKLGFHRQLRARIPERLMDFYLQARASFYKKRYGMLDA